MDSNIKNELIKSGFTESELKKLNFVLKNNNREKYPDLISIMPEMKRRFIRGCLLSVVILLTYPLSISDYNDTSELFINLLVVLFSLLMVYLITPLNLCFKCYLFIKNF